MKRGRRRQAWPHDRYRYLSELYEAEPGALVTVMVESKNTRERLAAVLYRTREGLFWREAWMAEPLPMASGDDAIRGPFAEHMRELVSWMTETKLKLAVGVHVTEHSHDVADVLDLSEENREWLTRLRGACADEQDSRLHPVRWSRWHGKWRRAKS